MSARVEVGILAHQPNMTGLQLRDSAGLPINGHRLPLGGHRIRATTTSTLAFILLYEVSILSRGVEVKD